MFPRLPTTGGKQAGAMGTDVISVGRFFFGGRQMVHPR